MLQKISEVTTDAARQRGIALQWARSIALAKRASHIKTSKLSHTMDDTADNVIPEGAILPMRSVTEGKPDLGRVVRSGSSPQRAPNRRASYFKPPKHDDAVPEDSFHRGGRNHDGEPANSLRLLSTLTARGDGESPFASVTEEALTEAALTARADETFRALGVDRFAVHIYRTRMSESRALSSDDVPAIHALQEESTQVRGGRLFSKLPPKIFGIEALHAGQPDRLASISQHSP